MISDRNLNRNHNERKSGRFIFRTVLCMLFVFSILTVFTASISADREQKSELLIRVQAPGIVYLEGDIAVNDMILLYSREYHSSEQIIIDKLLAETTAETAGTAF